MKAKLFGILGLLVVLCVLGAIGNPFFLLPNNVENLVSRISMYGILGIGVAFVIITGGIDLSIGSVVCLSACLLAIFLHVDYHPFQSAEVHNIRRSSQEVVLREITDIFQPGDHVYLNSVATVTEVREETVEVDERETRVTVLKIDRELRGGGYGQIWKVQPIVDYGEEGTRVRLAGETPRVRPHDQIMFVHAERPGYSRIPVESAQTEDGNTVVTLGDSFRSAGGDESSSGWYAVVEHRRQRMPVLVALGLVLLVAVGLGLLHGVLVTWLKVQPFVVTLCGLLIYRGVSRWLVDDQRVGFGNEYHLLRQLGRGKLVLWQSAQGADVGIPYPFFILLAVAVIAAIFLNKTIWGRYMLALGRNEEAARYSGINTSRMIMIAYVISTTLAAVGGILFALDSNSISPSSFGNFFELYAIAAAVLGGCSLRGGEGTISGVIIGTAVMRVLNNLIVLMRISDTLEFAVIGMVILLGVIADELIKRYAATRQRKAQGRAS